MRQFGRNDRKAERVANPKIEPVEQQIVPEGLPEEILFIKADQIPPNTEQHTQDLTSYGTTDGGPTYRIGRNIFSIKTADPEGTLKQLTNFADGWVSDLEVSYDGKYILFSRRGEAGKDPFWHIYEMKADGSELRQITSGASSNVHPNYMPDGRIVFTTTLSGIRDEYHGYPANSLAVMNRDGSDIHIISWNIGRDAEPVIGDDGKILFTRLELFYSRLKTEWNLLSVFPDGTQSVTLYGPERRPFFAGMGGAENRSTASSHLRMSQPQPWNRAQFLINTSKGPLITDGPLRENLLRKENDYAVTTPFPLNNETLLVAAGKRQLRDPKAPNSWMDGKYNVMSHVDHGLYYLDVKSGELTLIYNDPEMSEFEARPLQPRKVPPITPVFADTRSDDFSAKVFCNSVFNTRHSFVKERGKYIRIIEGVPMIARHQTHMSGGISWRNHGGAVGRVWATVPLAIDGSFALEIPSDRLFHYQVLDADKRVMGNEFLWQFNRPNENKSCVGCHENAGEAPPPMTSFPKAHRVAPVQCFPAPNDIIYHAKAWTKGWLNDEREERMRTVNGTDWFGRD